MMDLKKEEKREREKKRERGELLLPFNLPLDPVHYNRQ